MDASRPVFLQFLSTPSARRATAHVWFHFLGNPISIHALREEGDRDAVHRFYFIAVFLSTPSARRATLLQLCNGAVYDEFLSTPSARRATPPFRGLPAIMYISIHALREEGD